MIVAIHQPSFLPWMGYLNRMITADLFIILDHVQFERRNYQNRARIRFDGEARWLTVPVKQHSQLERIVEKEIDNPASGETPRWWGSNHYQTLRHAYRHAPFLHDYLPELRHILELRWSRLVELDDALLEFLRAAFDIHTPIVSSSDLRVGGARSDLILNLCRMVGADTYLAGNGGSRSYLDCAAFQRAGIQVSWQNYRHPRYRQCGGDGFIAGLSALDLLLNVGPQGRTLLTGEGEQPVPEVRVQRELEPA